jgi:hypothetical protein
MHRSVRYAGVSWALAAGLGLAGFLAACGRTSPLSEASEFDPGAPGGSVGVGGSLAGGAAGRASGGGAGRSGGAGFGGAAGNASGGAFGSDGASGVGGDGVGGASGSDGVGGVAGVAGTGVSGGAGSPGNDAGPRHCQFTNPPPINPTPAELERGQLIEQLCAAFARYGCLDHLAGVSPISGQARTCSQRERLIACEQDLLTSYLAAIAPSCHDEWLAAIRCNVGADYSRDNCQAPLDPSVVGQEPRPARCAAQRDTLWTCVQQNSNGAWVTGARTTCSYNRQAPDVCFVSCQIGQNYFTVEASAPPGLPLGARCKVNGTYAANQGVFYANGCRELAEWMADGECVDTLDCCYTVNVQGVSEKCQCYPADMLTAPSCAAQAMSSNGEVVPICPQYERDP